LCYTQQVVIAIVIEFLFKKMKKPIDVSIVDFSVLEFLTKN
jgi:hypothetical protein